MHTVCLLLQFSYYTQQKMGPVYSFHSFRLRLPHVSIFPCFHWGPSDGHHIDSMTHMKAENTEDVLHTAQSFVADTKVLNTNGAHLLLPW